MACYGVGRIILGLFGIEIMPLAQGKIVAMIDNFAHGRWGDNFSHLLGVMGVIGLGAFALGSFFGLVGATAYRIIAGRTRVSYHSILKRIQDIKTKEAQSRDD